MPQHRERGAQLNRRAHALERSRAIRSATPVWLTLTPAESISS
jgi:hypothetical protein